MPPNNAGYAYAAYAAAAAIYAGYACSLWWRARRLTARLANAADPPLRQTPLGGR
jgi:hypothetical protein